MQETPADHNPTPQNSGMPEPAPQPDDTAEATTSMAETGATGQVPKESPADTEATATPQVTEVLSPSEWRRFKIGGLGLDNFPLRIRSEDLMSFQEMNARNKFTRDAWDRIPFPTRLERIGNTGKLFAKIRGTIASQTQLSDSDCALPTFWVFSNWLRDYLPLAPGLVITGSAHDGDRVLRALNALSYHPVLLAGLNRATLNQIDWQRTPTLLISEPSLSREMAGFLGSSTCRGYLALRKEAGCLNYPYDFYGSKAIYVGEALPGKSVLPYYLHLNASPAPGAESNPALPLSQETIQSCQNQLLYYRLDSMAEVAASDFCVSGLTSEVNAIATALGRSVADAPDLQSLLLSLLQPVSQQQIEERLDDLDALAIDAALSLAHQGKEQILAGEIATLVNQGQKDRGEKLRYSAEQVGHSLKRARLPKRRLGSAGRGLLLDHTTLKLLHEIAARYGCAGLTDDQKNLHCSWCEQIK